MTTDLTIFVSVVLIAVAGFIAFLARDVIRKS